MSLETSSPTLRARLRVLAEDYGLLVIAVTFVMLAVVGGVLVVIGDQAFAESLITDYGMYALLGIFVLEGAMLLYFAPSEALVPVAITLLAQTPTGYDWSTVVLIFVAAVVGATAGQVALFLLAKRGGREWLLEKPWFRVEASKLDRFDRWFNRWGRPAIPVSNALLFTRGMLTVPAGIAEMDVREFAVLSALGTLVFESWLALSHHFADQYGIYDAVANLIPFL